MWAVGCSFSEMWNIKPIFGPESDIDLGLEYVKSLFGRDFDELGLDYATVVLGKIFRCLPYLTHLMLLHVMKLVRTFNETF